LVSRRRHAWRRRLARTHRSHVRARRGGRHDRRAQSSRPVEPAWCATILPWSSPSTRPPSA